ncbi:MAG TPA: hypothetical protein VJ327_09620 [Patescibacteria group bacterium]|nr:hypothetical protein [Patescibacteria group bacterium]
MSNFEEPMSRYYRSIGPEYSKIHNDKEMGYLGIARIPLIIGITGPTKAGKTMVSKHLVTEHGFHYECLSTYIREKSVSLGNPTPNWEELRDIAIQWRREEGLEILVKVLLQRLKQKGVLRTARAIVIDGVLHREEVRLLREIPNAHLISITAPLDLRYESTKAWESPENVPTIEEFQRRDLWERGLDGELRPPEAINIEDCIDLIPAANRFKFTGDTGSRALLLKYIDAFIIKARSQCI